MTRTKIRDRPDAIRRILDRAYAVTNKRLVFICRSCGEHFAEKLTFFLDHDERDIMAPNLCPTCGRYIPGEED